MRWICYFVFFFFLRKNNGVIRFNVVENLNHETLNFCFPLCEYETLSVRIHTLDILVPVDLGPVYMEAEDPG